MTGNGYALGSSDPPLALVGCDFRRAPASVRAALVLEKEERLALAADLKNSQVGRGLACLDTCNRTEWVVSSPNPQWAAEVLRAHMLSLWRERGRQSDLRPIPYVHPGRDAAEHLLSVAAGLQSLIVAETPIAGQVQRCLARARTEGTSDVYLNLLGPVAGRVARDARRLTAYGFDVRGLHHVAADILAKRLPRPAQVVVVGLGQMGLKVTGSLTERPGLHVRVANRSLKPVRSGIKVFTLDYLPHLLPTADAVVLCTGSPEPVLCSVHLEAVLNRPDRSDRPFLVMDLGLPAQVSHAARGLEGVEVVDLEELEAGAFGLNDEQQQRLEAVRKRVQQGADEYVRVSQVRPLVVLLDGLYKSHRRTVNEAIPELLSETLGDDAPEGLRSRLERQLKAMLRRHTNTVYESLYAMVERGFISPEEESDEPEQESIEPEAGDNEPQAPGEQDEQGAQEDGPCRSVFSE